MVVMMWVILKRVAREDQRLEANFGPQSELMWEGTPKQVIQAVKRAVAQAEAVVSSKGTASTKRVEWSMMVKM